MMTNKKAVSHHLSLFVSIIEYPQTSLIKTRMNEFQLDYRLEGMHTWQN